MVKSNVLVVLLLKFMVLVNVLMFWRLCDSDDIVHVSGYNILVKSNAAVILTFELIVLVQAPIEPVKYNAGTYIYFIRNKAIGQVVKIS